MSNINPFFAKMSESKTQQQSLSLTTGGKSLDDVQAMKCTPNFTASHGVEELSDEQLETVSGGWFIANPQFSKYRYTLY